MTKYERINKRIQSLFGEIGGNKGQYYCEGDNKVAEVINDGGGIRIVLYGNTPTDLLNRLDAIEEYLQFKKRKEEQND